MSPEKKIARLTLNVTMTTARLNDAKEKLAAVLTANGIEFLTPADLLFNDEVSAAADAVNKEMKFLSRLKISLAAAVAELTAA